MKTFVSFLIIALFPALAAAQSRTDATLRVTVVDPSGAVIVGARVVLSPSATGIALETGPRGDATFTAIEPGRYTIHVESPGFQPTDARDVRLRAGDNRREVKLAIAKFAEMVQVGRDARERASDPRGDAFATVLSQAQIDELPDDPDEMEQALRDMAGPGSVLRVNGFRGGRLPPKGQIQQIRFRRNMFAADTHEPGFVSIDITTKPGIDNWRGSTGLGFRDASLTARNAFAPVKGDEQHERYGFSLSGPLWKQHTSLSLSADGIDAFDTKTIVAALPSGYFADSIRKPNDSMNVSARFEHMLSASQMLRAEVQRNHGKTENLGVGDFDLAERGYSQARTEEVVRASNAGAIGKALYNELRVQWRSEDIAFTPVSAAPAVLVLNAFDAGGAQLAGSQGTNTVSITNDLDIAIGRHAIRTGIQLDAGRYRTSELRNTAGTFTFASLDAYAAGRPTTFTRNVGNPDVEIAQAQLGLYLQDDMRVRKDLTVSAGVRQEYQSHIGGFNLAPRGGIAWSPFRSGKTTIRGGGGVFFDWFDAQAYEQGVQLDGAHQQIDTIVQPGYPNPAIGGQPLTLPAGRVQFAPNLLQPRLTEAIAAIEQTFPGDVRVNTMYIRRRGSNQLRGVNVNAPLANGLRPDPSSGTVTEIQSTAGTEFDAISVNLNYQRMPQRLFIAANYMFGRSMDDTDSPFSLPADNYNLAAERGPALGFARHRFMSLANLPLTKRVRLGTSLRVQSGTPYNITTGRDDNGDTVSNDRPAGVTRNTGLGTAQIDLGMRLSWGLSFGAAAPPPAGPQVRIVRGDSADPLSSMGGMEGGGKRYAIELYAQAYNVLNHVNALNFSGVIGSPFFGTATSASAPRRVELGARLSF
ncbi:MAG TPA: carboxypeptidase regulatory-like domain-containing protein [Vicinamibacterales bacterium]|nr:carboxypeptidase regulatory-like domain-containing protein [Vicinamibacterales bacterium]